MTPSPARQLVAPLKPSQLREALLATFAGDRAPMIHGDPGIGKSEIMWQVSCELFAEKYGCKWDGQRARDKKGKYVAKSKAPWFRDVRAAQLDAVDLRGVPFVDRTPEALAKTLWAIPGFLPTDPRGGLFFLDEINRGQDMTLNALFSLVLTGDVGEYQKPETWRVGSAVNDKDIGAKKMSGALMSRFRHLYLVADLDDLCDHAIKADWDPVVVAWLRFKHDAMHHYDPKIPVSPNPRSWESISNMLKGPKVSKDVELALVAGDIGEAAALEFCAFLRMWRQLPMPDAVILNPTTTMVPTEPGAQYAIGAALGRRANIDNLGNIMTYLARLPIDWNIKTVKTIMRDNPELQSTEDFITWSVQYQRAASVS